MQTSFLQRVTGSFHTLLLKAFPHCKEVDLCPKFKNLEEGLQAELNSLVSPWIKQEGQLPKNKNVATPYRTV